ncbi:MAG: hypothetical protein NC543_01765 [bacterium]|nr:hypothetical protein [bacterium]MCM1373948.1 hypothetical protein [Muribaculum sp.]
MDIQNITKEQFETLILIRSLEEFVTDKYDNLSTLSGAVETLGDNLEKDERIQYIKDIYNLTKAGYILSDATAEDIENIKIPVIKRITLKGKSALKELEKRLNESPNKKEIAEEHIGNRFGIRDKIISDVLANTASVISIISSVLTIVATLMGMGG